VRRDTSESYQHFLIKLAQASGIETPTRADLCNCDDPKVSNFFHYFSHNFEKLKLKTLITTCYKNTDADLFSAHKLEKGIYLEYNGDKNDNRVPDPNEIGIHRLKGDGDFRSEECLKLLKQTDSRRNSMSERSFITLPTACLPLAVVAPLVEIVAAMSRSALTASKSKTPPEDSFNRSRWNGCPNRCGRTFKRTQSSHSN